MADLGAVPAAGGQVVYGGGLFNGFIWGAPYDFWIMFIGGLFFLVIIIYLVWRLFFVMNPVGEYFDAERSRNSVALKFTKNMRLKLMNMKYAAQIMEPEDPADTDKWKQTLAQSIGQLGSVNTVILCDWHDWIENPILNEAIATFAEKWNTVHPEDKIFDFFRFADLLYTGKVKEFCRDYYRDENGAPIDGIPVKPFFIVDPVKIEQYMPKQRDAASFGGWLRREAAMLNKNAEKPNLTPFLVMTGLGALIFIISLIFSYMNLT